MLLWVTTPRKFAGTVSCLEELPASASSFSPRPWNGTFGNYCLQLPALITQTNTLSSFTAAKTSDLTLR